MTHDPGAQGQLVPTGQRRRLTLVVMRNKKRASQRQREVTPEPDPRDLEYFNELVGRDIERFHRLVATDRLADILTNIAGLADARDPDATALLNAINPPSRRAH